MPKKIITTLLSLVPLIGLYSPADSFFPFIAGKVLLWGLVLGAISFVIPFEVLAKTKRNFYTEHFIEIIRKPLAKSYGFFLVTMTISVVLAYEPHVAWWGSFVRWEGLVTYFLLGIYFLYCSLFFTPRLWKNITKLTLLVVVISIVYSFGQIVAGTERPGALIGNPLFLAQYLLLAGGLVIATLASASSSKNKVLMYVMTLAVFFGILFTQTRGVIVGVVVGVIVGLITFLVQSENHKIKIFWISKSSKWFAGVILAIFMCFSGLFIATRDSVVWHKIPILKRFAGSEIIDSTSKSRIISINTSIASILPKNEGWKRTLFGWGNENYQFAWSKYYNPELYHYDSASFDRAHNKYFDVLVMQGVVGFIAYLVLLAVYFVSIYKLHGAEKYILLIVWTAYCVQNIFAFESFFGYVYLVLLGIYLMFNSYRNA